MQNSETQCKMNHSDAKAKRNQKFSMCSMNNFLYIPEQYFYLVWRTKKIQQKLNKSLNFYKQNARINK